MVNSNTLNPKTYFTGNFDFSMKVFPINSVLKCMVKKQLIQSISSFVKLKYF